MPLLTSIALLTALWVNLNLKMNAQVNLINLFRIGDSNGQNLAAFYPSCVLCPGFQQMSVI